MNSLIVIKKTLIMDLYLDTMGSFIAKKNLNNYQKVWEQLCPLWNLHVKYI